MHHSGCDNNDHQLLPDVIVHVMSQLIGEHDRALVVTVVGEVIA
jgi:hypothetical protein